MTDGRPGTNSDENQKLRKGYILMHESAEPPSRRAQLACNFGSALFEEANDTFAWLIRNTLIA